jgi:hypothetical protein
MHRMFGTILMTGLILLSVSQAGFSYDSPQKYGIQFGGGMGQYDLGDISQGMDYMKSLADKPTVNESDMGPVGNVALLFRPSRHQLWEVGFNALLDVENSVQNDTATGQILMHANEFFLKANVVTYPLEKLHLNLGLGLAYYNAEVQIQDEFSGRFNYDAVGRGWGLIGSAGIELLLQEHLGLYLGGGGRVMNASQFSYESVPGVRTFLPVLGGSRPMEVNLTGGYANVGLRFYFDQFTKPIDFTR